MNLDQKPKLLKSAIVERLLSQKSITAEEAAVLLDNQMEIPSIQYPPIPNLMPEQIPNRNIQFDPSTCSCHLSKGGSGICGCIRGSQEIIC